MPVKEQLAKIEDTEHHQLPLKLLKEEIQEVWKINAHVYISR